MTGFDAASYVRNLTELPGVYQMYDASGALLYVGKARNLRKRVASYFRDSGQGARTEALVARIAEIQVTVTGSETGALLLEQNLIKSQHPPFNILLRDDKSYPYIFLSQGEQFPRLGFHRGAKRANGRYFGPFPSSSAVRESLNLLQKVFRVRQCEDSFFRNRSRPCLQYQIQRCSGPCVGLVDEAEYAESVHDTALFLEGKSTVLASELADRMERAAAALEFERAAVLRDQIRHLQAVREKQFIESGDGNIDVIAAAAGPGAACVQALFVRDGRILGSKSYFPRCRIEESAAEVLAAFVPQFYFGARGERQIPAEILVSEQLEDADLLSEALAGAAGRKVAVSTRVRASRAQWLKLAVQTAQQNLGGFLASRQRMHEQLAELQDALGLEAVPERIECFDISHSAGELAVASCVVFDGGGPLKSDYRRFNIEDITPGDDYAAMRQALERRYTRLKSGEGRLPDLLLIDGGKGQMSEALKVLEELQIEGVTVVAVAKGTTRRPGLETLVVGLERRERVLAPDSTALHLIQQVRDEAHRFAISALQKRRGKKSRASPLEGIAGVGPKRRRELLRYFGGLQGIERASLEELVRVPTISRRIAEDVYAAFHNQ
ncbi:MAG: excinuclease ABC subunit UvrC [Pseudomonadales bacterium]|jgi:excinuclease ABC subunit C|nr:excinuclease ABC subunit UvrC [Gammaproteobacteria bacterium]MBP6051314.1 excinuclease ABC subunit UvrC [Pseudomonadales bacterium]MBK7522421.1 excinuclease ABC subunit UvrC [Gammaproteobacteria bacterium]MBK8307958.1 excinuclease ABC subunit UvrC [Gammaproteobacteria bacterium]MBK9664353.1 excinuclease ABC subunit UvrC [Gammaproteobacteria bacterium]